MKPARAVRHARFGTRGEARKSRLSSPRLCGAHPTRIAYISDDDAMPRVTLDTFFHLDTVFDMAGGSVPNPAKAAAVTYSPLRVGPVARRRD